MEVSIVFEEFKILSVKNFYNVNLFERLIVNNIIENNYRKNYNSFFGYNFLIDSNYIFFRRLYNKFLNLSKKTFKTFHVSDKNKTSCWCYRSFNSDYSPIYHNHIKTSTINSVYYYNINKGDSIQFLEYEKEFTYFPSQEELLIFPNYLLHKPNKPNGNKYRYSINMEITTEETSTQLFGYEKLWQRK